MRNHGKPKQKNKRRRRSENNENETGVNKQKKTKESTKKGTHEMEMTERNPNNGFERGERKRKRE